MVLNRSSRADVLKWGGKGRKGGISTPLTPDRGNGAKGRDDDGGAKGKAGHDYDFLGMSGCSLG